LYVAEFEGNDPFTQGGLFFESFFWLNVVSEMRHKINMKPNFFINYELVNF